MYIYIIPLIISFFVALFTDFYYAAQVVAKWTYIITVLCSFLVILGFPIYIYITEKNISKRNRELDEFKSDLLHHSLKIVLILVSTFLIKENINHFVTITCAVIYTSAVIYFSVGYKLLSVVETQSNYENDCEGE